MKRWHAPVLAATTLVSLLVSLESANALERTLEPILSVMTATGLFTTVLLAISMRVARKVGGERLALFAALHAASAVPSLALGVGFVAWKYTVWGCPSWGCNDTVNPAFAFGFAPAALVTAIAMVFLGRHVASVERRWDRRIRLASVIVMAFVGLLAAVALVRARRLPDADHYAREMPVVVVLPRIVPPTEKPTTLPGHQLARLLASDRVGTLRAARFQDWEGLCRTYVGLDGKMPLDQDVPHGTLLDFKGTESCPELQFKCDATNDVWRIAWSEHNYYFSSLAYSPRHPDAYRLSISRVAQSLSAPRGWIYGAILGLALALVSQLDAWRARRPLGRLARARAGEHEGDGWVRWEDDGTRQHLPQAAVFSPGPLLVDGEHKPAATGYRSSEVWLSARVVPGRREDMARAASDMATTAAAYALACVLLTGVPLAGAALMRLVF
jgi:hypothetical protein